MYAANSLMLEIKVIIGRLVQYLWVVSGVIEEKAASTAGSSFSIPRIALSHDTISYYSNGLLRCAAKVALDEARAMVRPSGTSCSIKNLSNMKDLFYR